MDGGRYFAIRDRLEPVAAGVAELARRHGIGAAGMEEGGDGGTGPWRRLMLVVFGETNAGKSSLLNSLFGRLVCPVDALPDRGPMVWYGVGGRAGLPAGMAWRELPADGRLRGFEWIDTPGINGLDGDGRRLLLDCCVRADGVLAVLHAANPWEPATWDLLARLGEDVLDRTVVVLAQTDRKDPADLPVLRSHLRELSLRKVGREMPSSEQAWPRCQRVRCNVSRICSFSISFKLCSRAPGSLAWGSPAGFFLSRGRTISSRMTSPRLLMAAWVRVFSSSRTFPGPG